MNALFRPVIAALAFLFAGAAPAAAQDGLDVHTLEAFGGTYKSDCGKSSAATLTIARNTLTFVEGARKLAGTNVMTAASYWGPDMPDTYRTTILSEVGGNQLLVIVHEDEKGPYVLVSADPAVRLSDAIQKTKFRTCGERKPKLADHADVPAQTTPAPAKATTAKPAPAGTPGSGVGITASGMLADRKFKAAWLAALGARANQPWLARLDGPSPENRRVTVDGADYLLIAACKNHDCYDYSTVILWSAPKKRVFGLVHEAGRTALLGGPTPALATELRALWKAEFRKGE
jgi:hypothetical protein